MPMFNVTVRRSTYAYQTVKVKADDKQQAKENAEFELEDDDSWNVNKPDDVDIQAISVEEA